MRTPQVKICPNASLEIKFNNPTRRKDDWFFLSAVDNDEGKNLILLSVIAQLEAKDRIQPLGPGENVVHIQGKQLRLKGKIYLEWRMARQDRNDPPRCDNGMSTPNEKKRHGPYRPKDGEALSSEEGQRADTFHTTLFYVADVANLPYDATISSGALQDCKLIV